MTKRAFIGKYMKGNWFKLLCILCTAILAVLLNLLHPLVFSFFIDNIIDQQPITSPIMQQIVAHLGGVSYLRSHIWIGGIVIIAIYFFLGIALFIRGYLSGRMSEDMCYHIRNDLYTHLQKLPFHYHVSANTGDLVQRCTSDVDQIRRLTGNQLQQAMRSIFMVVLACVILFRIHVKMAIRAVILMPFLFLYAYYFYLRNQKAFKASDESEARMTTVIQENLNGIRVVKAFGREQYEAKQFDRVNGEHRDITFRMIALLGAYWSSTDVICMIQIMIVLFSGIFAARSGELSIGNFMVFVSYESMILWPIRQLGRILADFGKCSVSIGRLLEILNEKEEDLVSGITPEMKGEIVFDHVSYQYEDGTSDVLEDISMHIGAGQTVAIIGPTGSGKSTLVHLLTGLYDYTGGSIRIDGNELRNIQKQYLRQKVGIVLQEPFLFSKSIYENIHLNHNWATREDVERAARIANVDEVIREFDEGYETMVGEKGVTLSGGQKQRVAIARTILNDNKVLIFDDSLSVVDTETDKEIRARLKELQKQVTTIIITHRINSAKDADCIFVIEKGKITSSGTHEELIHQEGLYRRIYEIQSNYIERGEEDDRDTI